MTTKDPTEADRAVERMRRDLQDKLDLSRADAESIASSVAYHAWAYGLGPPMHLTEFRKRTLNARESFAKAKDHLQQARTELRNALKVAPLQAIALGSVEGVPDEFNLPQFRREVEALDRLAADVAMLAAYCGRQHEWACSRPNPGRGRRVDRHRLRFVDRVLYSLTAHDVPKRRAWKGLRIAMAFAGVRGTETDRALDRLAQTRLAPIRRAIKAR